MTAQKNNILLYMALTASFILIFLLLLHWVTSPVEPSQPDGGYSIKCLKECAKDFRRCHMGCNPLDDDCWRQCEQELIACVSLCEMGGWVGMPPQR